MERLGRRDGGRGTEEKRQKTQHTGEGETEEEKRGGKGDRHRGEIEKVRWRERGRCQRDSWKSSRERTRRKKETE